MSGTKTGSGWLEKISDEAIRRFEEEAIKIGKEDKVFRSRKDADRFLEARLKKA
jgi:hypothetical protein